jgi:aconitate hydratase
MQTGVGSTIYAVRPGDGAAREQAASCQRVLAVGEYLPGIRHEALRSNLINWAWCRSASGEPFLETRLHLLPGARAAVMAGKAEIEAYAVGEKVEKITLTLAPLTEDERKILARAA